MCVRARSHGSCRALAESDPLPPLTPPQFRHVAGGWTVTLNTTPTRSLQSPCAAQAVRGVPAAAGCVRALPSRSARARPAGHDRNLFDPDSSHTLVSKIKPCKGTFNPIGENAGRLITSVIVHSTDHSTWITVVTLELIHARTPDARRAVFIRLTNPSGSGDS